MSGWIQATMQQNTMDEGAVDVQHLPNQIEYSNDSFCQVFHR